jgi:nitrogen fixation NifU-like protein
MYSPAMLDHFQNPRNAGELPPPAVTVDVSNPACGDIMRLSLLVEQNQIRDVRFKAKGCVAAIACGSLLTELVQGKSLEDAAQLSAAGIAGGLGGLPPASGHAAVLAEDALKAALKKLAGNR